MKLNVGTRSVLYGVHCALIHPFFVALGWWRLYGFPWDPRLWVAFFVHDLGYWGKPNIDGPEGERHVRFGARLMHRVFDRWCSNNHKWYYFCLYHSRFYTKQGGGNPSRLCYADKMAFCLTPWWLYRRQANWSGEIKEYMASAAGGSKYAFMQIYSDDQRTWFENGKKYMLKWVYAHYKGERDTWTILATSPHRKFCLPRQLLATGPQTRSKCTLRTPGTT